MRYTVYCAACGPREIIRPMSEAAEYMPCDSCGRPRPQVFHPPMFQEDRVRFFKGSLGNGYSTALGERMPDSRQKRDALARRKGVEFVSRDEFLADNKEAQEAVEYQAHVSAGGERVEPQRPDTSGVWKEKPAWAESLT